MDGTNRIHTLTGVCVGRFTTRTAQKQNAPLKSNFMVQRYDDKKCPKTNVAYLGQGG